MIFYLIFVICIRATNKNVFNDLNENNVSSHFELFQSPTFIRPNECYNQVVQSTVCKKPTIYSVIQVIALINIYLF